MTHETGLWRIEARKYDQRLHYTLPARLIEDDGERVRLRCDAGFVLDHRTRGWLRPLQRRSDMIFWRERWYNVYLNYDDQGQPGHYYCNVGLPPIVNGASVTFVDLDLDMRFWPDGRYEVLDEDEFRAHNCRYGYTRDVREGAMDALRDLMRLWRDRQPPFDGSWWDVPGCEPG